MTQDYKPKLIEVALPLMKINAEAAREKSIRHGHPSTLHLWWARRPLAAARAVLWASLVDDPSSDPERFPTIEAQQKERDRLFDILERLVPWEASTDTAVLAEAKAEINRCFDGKPPSVLDPFGGGGTIPLEAQRLGLSALSGDLNPVAVLIQKAMLEIPPLFCDAPPVHPDIDTRLSTWTQAQGLAADVEAYGRWMGIEAAKRIGNRYPAVLDSAGESRTPIAWIWARTVESPDPSWGGHVPLVGSWVLRKSPRKPVVWVEAIVDRQSQLISYEVREDGEAPVGTVQRGQGTCIATGTPIPGDYIKAEAQAGRMGFVLLATVAEGDRGRSYFSPIASQENSAAVGSAGLWRPSGDVPRNLTGGTCYAYGLDEWGKLFTDRQLLALNTFSDLVEEARALVAADAVKAGLLDEETSLADGGVGASAYADAVATYLGMCVSRCTARWCSLTAWHNGGEKIEHVFRRQSIPMVWDFPEANPFSSSTANWAGQVEWVVKCFATLPVNGKPASVQQRDARARVREVGECAIATDPPYYDNIAYADLSDFYYGWLRRSLSGIWPEEFATLQTPKAEELIANRHRAGSREAAFKHFESGMSEVFAEIGRAQIATVPATVFYAFKQAEESASGRSSTGWETFLQGLLDAGLTVTATWPMRTEMTTGLKVGKSMLASSIVLACRPRTAEAALETRGGFVAALHAELPAAVRLLQQENIAPVDLAQSAIGPGMRIFSRYSQVVEADGSRMRVRAALGLINEVLGEVLSSEESELDADSRFALTWFEQFGHVPGPFGDADVLARAKDTSVTGVVESGIAVTRDGRVRLLERSELLDGWSPLTDVRPTVWEATQHLLRCLAHSESSAAQLLAQLGGVGDRARQLSYLLYGVCERNGWAEDANTYNGLIAAWPELTRLASGGSIDSDQQALL